MWFHHLLTRIDIVLVLLLMTFTMHWYWFGCVIFLTTEDPQNINWQDCTVEFCHRWCICSAACGWCPKWSCSEFWWSWSFYMTEYLSKLQYKLSRVTCDYYWKIMLYIYLLILLIFYWVTGSRLIVEDCTSKTITIAGTSLL